MTTERPMTLRRRAALPTTRQSLRAAALIAGIALVGACGSPSTAPASNTTASASAAASPSASTTTSPTSPMSPTSPVPSSSQGAEREPSTPGGSESSAGTSGGQTTAKGTTAPTLPRDAGDYGEALIEAWQAGDTSRIATLASPAAAAALRSAKAPRDLLLTACEDALCSWSNEAGARLTLTYDPAKVSAGRAQAVTAAKIAKA